MSSAVGAYSRPMVRDSRGARPVLVLGAVVLVVTLGLTLTIVPHDLYPLIKVCLGLGFALLLAGLVRLRAGRALGGGEARVAEATTSNAGSWIALRRAFGFLVDAAIIGGLGVAFAQVGDPRTDYSLWSSSDPVTYATHQFVGLEALKIFFPYVVDGHVEELAGLVLAMFGFSVWLVPALWLGATPGMLVSQLRWVRRSDGERVGALHALARAVPVMVFSPVVFAYCFFGHVRYRGGGSFSAYQLRTHLTDFIGRTFTMPS